MLKNIANVMWKPKYRTIMSQSMTDLSIDTIAFNPPVHLLFNPLSPLHIFFAPRLVKIVEVIHYPRAMSHHPIPILRQ